MAANVSPDGSRRSDDWPLALDPANSEACTTVYVTSTKKLSNVVLHFEDGTHQKFDDLSGGYTGNFAGTGETLARW